jgi:hypothetical protein
MLSNPRICREPSWTNGTVQHQDVPVRGPPGTLSHEYREPVHYVHSLQTPRSQSQTSTSSSSPHHNVAQLDMFGAAMAANAWQGPRQPPAHEHSCMPLPGQAVYHLEEHRAPAYQVCHFRTCTCFMSSTESVENHAVQIVLQPLQTFMAPPPALHSMPMDHAVIFAHPPPHHATHQQAPFRHPPAPAGVPRAFDGCHGRPGMARNDSSRERIQQTSPTRYQTSPIRHQASPIRYQTSPTRQQTSPTRQQASPTRHQGQMIKETNCRLQSSRAHDSGRMGCNSMDDTYGGQVLTTLQILSRFLMCPSVTAFHVIAQSSGSQQCT